MPKTIKKTSQKIQPKLELDDKEVDTIIASIKIDSPVEISSTVNNCHFMTNLIEQKNIDLQAMMRFVNQLNQVLEKDGLQATANIGDLKKLNLTALKVYVQTIELFSHEKILLEQHLRNLRELKKYRAAVYKNIEFSKVESRDSPSPQFGETYIHNIFFRVKSTYLQNENSKITKKLPVCFRYEVNQQYADGLNLKNDSDFKVAEAIVITDHFDEKIAVKLSELKKELSEAILDELLVASATKLFKLISLLKTLNNHFPQKTIYKEMLADLKPWQTRVLSNIYLKEEMTEENSEFAPKLIVFGDIDRIKIDYEEKNPAIINSIIQGHGDNQDILTIEDLNYLYLSIITCKILTDNFTLHQVTELLNRAINCSVSVNYLFQYGSISKEECNKNQAEITKFRDALFNLLGLSFIENETNEHPLDGLYIANIAYSTEILKFGEIANEQPVEVILQHKLKNATLNQAKAIKTKYVATKLQSLSEDFSVKLQDTFEDLCLKAGDEILKNFCEADNLNQTSFAKAVGTVSISTICKIVKLNTLFNFLKYNNLVKHEVKVMSDKIERWTCKIFESLFLSPSDVKISNRQIKSNIVYKFNKTLFQSATYES